MTSDTIPTATASDIHDALKREIRGLLRALRRNPDRLKTITTQIDTLADFADSLDWAALAEYGTQELAKLRRELRGNSC